MTGDLVAFLRARLDEDERLARAAAEPEKWVELNREPRPRWYVQLWADPDRVAVIADPESSAFPVVVSIEGMDEGDAQNRIDHIARHDPARVLADIEAKRRVVRYYEDAARTLAAAEPGTPPHDLMTGAMNSLRAALQALALPYADHPDYREEWRP
ncbi:DUF6221 family protein [Streptomyces qinglanensis]|uniref:Uncharacterized protein n=1 Tax=Streptomyces qinglanensis TaxID=943816 RepID=A0A1H9U0T3_9ACTN|nr:DUF6221 family protein [Streptomyces qinglanensis]SES03075.1 hypothetical protein SAMN05421870_107199 [Streptomyces qinglanensis]